MKIKIDFREKKIYLFYKFYLPSITVEQLQYEAVHDKYLNFTNEQVKKVEKIIELIKEIEEKIQPLLNDWNWTELKTLEKAILVNSFYEIFYLKKSKKIIINEYINLSKRYGTTDSSYKIINGILDSINI